MAKLTLRGMTIGLAALIVGAVSLPADAHPSAVRAASPEKVTISMGYIPDVQFTPFYVADSRGYYKAAGLQVHYD